VNTIEKDTKDMKQKKLMKEGRREYNRKIITKERKAIIKWKGSSEDIGTK
jgi:hypothetical protein